MKKVIDNKKMKTQNKKEGWEDWTGMPEFIQEDLSPFRSVSIHFRNQEDMDAFFVLINQKLK